MKRCSGKPVEGIGNEQGPGQAETRLLDGWYALATPELQDRVVELVAALAVHGEERADDFEELCAVWIRTIDLARR